MPLYEYRCPLCNREFSAVRAADNRNAPIECPTPKCKGAGNNPDLQPKRLLSVPSSVRVN